MSKSQLEKLSKKEIIEEYFKLSSIAVQLKNIETKIESLSSDNKKLEAQLAIERNCHNLILKKMIRVERNQLSTSQYLRRESLELNSIPLEISDQELEEKMCQALSLTGQAVSKSDLQDLHRLKSKQRLIVKFKDRKIRKEVYSRRRALKGKKRGAIRPGFTC